MKSVIDDAGVPFGVTVPDGVREMFAALREASDRGVGGCRG